MGDAPHQKLKVWHKAFKLVGRVYAISEGFPKAEQFGLTSQARRAAVSVVSNISEGAGRWSGKDKLRFYVMARGSLTEVGTQLELAESLGFHADEDVADEIAEVGRMLNGLITSHRMREIS